MAKFTFLLPAFKGRFLGEMLRSIQIQTYKDFKVIVSDDCSPEDIYTICKPFLDDSRYLYRRNEENLGKTNLIAHWNLLVEMCDTDYCILASDDDVYEPNFLQEVDKLSIKYQQVDLIHARANMIDEEGIVIRRDVLYMEFAPHLFFLSQYEYFNHIECVANNVYRTRKLKAMGGFVDFPLAWASDTATNFTISKNGVANTKEILFSFRMSGQNISSKELEQEEITKKKYEAIMLFEKFFEDLIKSISPQTKEEKELLKTISFYHRYIHIKNAACYYSQILSIKDFILFLFYFKQKGYFNGKYEIYKLIKRWCIKKISPRKFALYKNSD